MNDGTRSIYSILPVASVVHHLYKVTPSHSISCIDRGIICIESDQWLYDDRGREDDYIVNFLIPDTIHNSSEKNYLMKKLSEISTLFETIRTRLQCKLY